MTKVNSIGGMEQVPQSPQKTQNGTPLKPDKRMEIREGMRVADVKANGSEAQKLAAEAFDVGYKDAKNGIYNKNEAEFFNSFRFAIDPNKQEFRAHNTKTGCTVIIKYDNLDNLKQRIGLIRKADNITKNGTITFDLKNNSCVYDDVITSRSIMLGSQMASYTIKNCDCHTILANNFNGKLNIINTADMGIIRNRATQIHVTNGEEPELKVDNDSKVEIKRFESRRTQN